MNFKVKSSGLFVAVPVISRTIIGNANSQRVVSAAQNKSKVNVPRCLL